MTPPGLPDAAVLGAWANALFASLPGQAPALAGGLGGTQPPVPALPAGASPGPLAQGPQLPGTVLPGAQAAPQSPQSVLTLGASAPSLVPHATTGHHLPDSVATAAPALDSRAGGQALGVPEAHQGHYLHQLAGYPTTVQAYEHPREDRVSAQAWGLPGDADLRALLADNPRLSAPRQATPQHAPPEGLHAQPYYFLSDNPHTQAQVPAARHPAFDVAAVRRDFPILQERVNGRQLVWLDNAATTHKPQAVIDRLAYFYAHENSNIHRAAHALAARATDAYESARSKVRDFLGASSVNEIIFVRGATEAINLVAKTWGDQHVGEGDEIIVSHLEHHANIVPWQQLAARKGAKIRVIPVDDSGQVLLDEYQKLLSSKTRIVAVTQVSNALGTVVPVKQIVELAHRAGAKALVDGAQSVSHMRVNVQDIGADFFVFSGHKVFAPTGIGVLYGTQAVLDDMPPWQGGGNMIADVTFERTLFQPAPNKFEAGTGNIADAVGLGAAIDYVQRLGLENIARYEHDLLAYATQALQPVPGVRLVGTAQDKASVLSFVLRGYTTEEVGRALNEEGIAVRSGHHCAQPILRRFGLEATVRPSLAFYNTCDEVDQLVAVVRRLSAARRT